MSGAAFGEDGGLVADPLRAVVAAEAAREAVDAADEAAVAGDGLDAAVDAADETAAAEAAEGCFDIVVGLGANPVDGPGP